MWPANVLIQFQIVPPNPVEADFHGPYNKLLNTLFPPQSEFTVVPQYLPHSDRGAADYIVLYEIQLRNMPVFVLELKPPNHLDSLSKRHDADAQLRDRMAHLSSHCPLPTLHAVSAIGTRLCFYSLNLHEQTLVIVPRAIPRDPIVLTDTAPADRWALDVLEPAGETKLRAVIQEIIDGCSALRSA